MIDLSNFLSGLLTGFCLALIVPFPWWGGEEGNYYGPAELFDAWVSRSDAIDLATLRLRYTFLAAGAILTGCIFVAIGRW